MSATERPAARVGMSWDRKAGPGLVQKVGIAGRTVLVGVVIHFQHLKAKFNCCHLERRTKVNLPKVSWLRRARPFFFKINSAQRCAAF